MFLKKATVIVFCLLMLSQLGFAQHGQAPSQGDGSRDYPFEISNFSHLLWIQENSELWNSHFLQTAHIDASATDTMANGSGWYPIGFDSLQFKGTYNGQNFEIQKLTTRVGVNHPGDIGLFGVIDYQGVVKNIVLTNDSIVVTGLSNPYIYNIGGIAGRSLGEIEHCRSINGYIKLSSIKGGQIGGIIGYHSRPSSSRSKKISDCKFIGTIDATVSSPSGFQNITCGGILGSGSRTDYIQDCQASGTIMAETNRGYCYAGGIAGNLYQGLAIKRCWANTSTYAQGGNYTYAGGIAGYCYQKSTEQCYAYGDTYASGGFSRSGGLYGYCDDDLSQCYARVKLNAANAGGLAGSLFGDVQACFFDSTAAGSLQTKFNGTSNYDAARSSADLQKLDTFLRNGWNFICDTTGGYSHSWAMDSTTNNGYPFFPGDSLFTTDTPIVTTEFYLCKDLIYYEIKANGQNLKWYTTTQGLDCTEGSSIYVYPKTEYSNTRYVSQTDSMTGCESRKVAIKINIGAPLPKVDTLVKYCLGDTSDSLSAQGQNLKWYSSLTTLVFDSRGPIPSTDSSGIFEYYVSQTNDSGCESERAKITVQIGVLEAPSEEPLNYCQGDSINLSSFDSTWLWFADEDKKSPITGLPRLDGNQVQDTIFYYAATNAFGCISSTQPLDIVVNPLAKSDIYHSQCEGTYSFFGKQYTSSVVVTGTQAGQSVNGCDSLVTLYLTISKTMFGTVDTTLCGGSYLFNDSVYFSSNYTATDTLFSQAHNGCDSIVLLNLTILKPTNGTVIVEQCGGTYMFNGVEFAESNNSATDTLFSQAYNGCDSIVHLDLTVYPMPTAETIVRNDRALELRSGWASYQWLDCNAGFMEIADAQGSSFVPVENGLYSCEITDENNCKDTAVCYAAGFVGISYLDSPMIKVFPNPASEILAVQGAKGKYLITDLQGKLVMQGELRGDTLYVGDLKPQAYVLAILIGEKWTRIFWLKQ